MRLSETKVVDVHTKTVLEGAALVALHEQQAPAGDGRLEISHAQERIWFLEQIEPGNPTNLLTRIVHLSGKLDAGTLQLAFNELVKRQETLRTTFAAAAIYAGVDGRPVPIIAASAPFALTVVELAHLSRAERDAKVAHLTRLEAREPFDLSRGPLFRAKLLRLGDDEHLLLLSMHRMIADEVSCVILIREVCSLYESFINNAPLALEPLPVQYTTVANQQRTWLQTDAGKKRIDDAKELLRGAPALLELPADRPRPPKRSYGGARASIDVPREVADVVEQLSERARVNSSTVLLAVFQTLLARYTSQSEIVLGMPVSDRSTETESLIAPLANSAVLRTKVETEGSFREQLDRTSRSLAVALSLQDVPFERLVDQLDPQRSLSHTPIFQVMFKPDDPALPKYDLAQLSEIDRGVAVCEFDLTLSVCSRDGETLRLSVDYNTDLFDAATIERLLKNFLCLLEGVVANPEQRLSTVQLLHPEERQQLLSWNQTTREYEREACIHELIERQVAVHAKEVAVVFGEEQLTYEELNGRANQLAAYLRERLVEECLVGINLDRGVELVIAVLAVLKAGAAYVPLSPEQPAARLAYMIEDAGLRLIITTQDLFALLPAQVVDTVAVVSLDAQAEAIAAESTANVCGSASAASLAYVIYTSGSTGAPKAVEITHSAVVNFLQAMQRRPGLKAADRLLAVTTLSFDIAALELYLPLTVGGSVELTSGVQAGDGQYLKAKLESGVITAMQATPATWRLLVEAGWAGNGELKILCGGEALPRELANELLERTQSVWNMYGPTETTIWSAAGELAERDGPVFLGEPIANTQLYVLDAAMELAPLGVAGELYIGGEGLARGYHQRAALTAERFVPNPYASTGGERLYRTGDLVRRQADGRLEFLGRLDHQVKIRGFRIETGEIEALLRQHATVRDAVVVVREDYGEKRLVAYLVLQPQQTVTTDELRAHLRRSLPDYMIPSAFVVLDELPLTANRKVDRKALPPPGDSRPALKSGVEKPEDSLEAQLVTICQKVLGIAPVGVTDNFFDLGGHSLLAVRLFAQIENRFGKVLPLATLFEAPTMRGLAAVLRREGCRQWSSLVAIRSTGSKPPLFCIHAAGANVLIYRPLANHLDAEQPVYALQALGLDGLTMPLTRVEEMAAYYLKEIRTVQPNGPYYLAGGSFGGLVAFEIAQQLQAEREQVAMLALLDTYCPLHSLTQRVRCHWAHLVERGPATYTADALVAVSKRLRRMFSSGAASVRVNADTSNVLPGKTEFQDPLVRAVQANIEAENIYAPRGEIYRGRIIFFYAEDRAGVPAYEDNRLRWAKMATEGMEVHRIPGTHITMREEPNVAVLAKVMKECLDKAQRVSAETSE